MNEDNDFVNFQIPKELVPYFKELLNKQKPKLFREQVETFLLDKLNSKSLFKGQGHFSPVISTSDIIASVEAKFQGSMPKEEMEIVNKTFKFHHTVYYVLKRLKTKRLFFISKGWYAIGDFAEALHEQGFITPSRQMIDMD